MAVLIITSGLGVLFVIFEISKGCFKSTTVSGYFQSCEMGQEHPGGGQNM